MEAGLSDSPDTPSPIADQEANGATAQWTINSSTESYVSCDEQAGNSEMGGLMKKSETGMSSAFDEEEETFPEEDTQEE
ncbi:hypothetical protein Baya_11749 [Bagarius yarrelli]|uniref:Uncharacterized protein n=1 Tax=Bagarius yarrelli TaxID=175774 RepID=A0A556V1F5_BAGYA|nr:hypothetical protein Baya_11749 [Bagarius yarrelli]